MLKHIQVVPLAAESLGVRSMCTYVETRDVRVLLDAGVSLCPKRFGLPPHPLEFKAIMEARRRIAEAAKKSEVVTISHYHFDHHTPSYEDWLCNWTEEDETARSIYGDKIVLMKHPREHINFSQRRRAWVFQKTGGSYAKKLEIADEKTFVFGKTTLKFSKPVFHGSENSELGWVLMASIECEGERFLFAPDVQGPISTESLKIILKLKPELLLLGGPPLYLTGFRINEKHVYIGLANMRQIVRVVPYTIVEHHLLRDADWRGKIADVLTEAEKAGCKVLTAAEFLGAENKCLEVQRKNLYQAHPPSKEFEKWMRMSVDEKRRNKPPI